MKKKSDDKKDSNCTDHLKTQGFKKIGVRIFNFDDQKKFADFSGDYNPIHLDKVEARKNQNGHCFVHGINVLLWILECLVKSSRWSPCKFEIKFQKPINVNSKVICLWSNLKRSVKIITEENEILFTLSYEKPFDMNDRISNIPIHIRDKLSSPKENDLNKLLKEHKYPMKYGGEASFANSLYPQLSEKIGCHTVYEVALLSNIVGMQVPGLYSLFISASIELISHKNIVSPFFKLDSIDHRFGIVHLEYFGNNISGKLKTLERPHYKIKKCSEIKQKIPKPLTLKGKKILIVGGSRGIGASIAKVVSIIGAKTTITYNLGVNDARKLCDDIGAFTKQKVKAIKLDVTDINQLESLKFDYDFLFFFASPKIRETQGEFNFNIFDNFYQIYCKAFYLIAKNFYKTGGTLIYWPSTIFLSKGIKNFEEYMLAKLIGEKICNKLKLETQMKIIVERLDKIETDQTMGLIKTPMKDSVEVAIKITKLICHLL